MSTGDGYGTVREENGEFCIAVARTGILTQLVKGTGC